MDVLTPSGERVTARRHESGLSENLESGEVMFQGAPRESSVPLDPEVKGRLFHWPWRRLMFRLKAVSSLPWKASKALKA